MNNRQDCQDNLLPSGIRLDKLSMFNVDDLILTQ